MSQAAKEEYATVSRARGVAMRIESYGDDLSKITWYRAVYNGLGTVIELKDVFIPEDDSLVIVPKAMEPCFLGLQLVHGLEPKKKIWDPATCDAFLDKSGVSTVIYPFNPHWVLPKSYRASKEPYFEMEVGNKFRITQ